MRTDEAQNLPNPEALVRAALAERCRANPRYSMRAFSRASGISHTVLSLVLSGKRKFSKKALHKLADFLALDPQQAEQLLQKAGSPPGEYDDLHTDTFEMISDWYHYAILSALELPEAKFEAGWIAKTLGISLMQAKLAMDRLERLGLVEKRGRKYQQTGKPLAVNNTRSTAATRHFHRQLLEKAKDAIENTPFHARDFSSTTFVMDPEHIPYARKRIQEFRRQLAAELNALGPPKTVYNLTVQLIPASPIQPQKEK